MIFQRILAWAREHHFILSSAALLLGVVIGACSRLIGLLPGQK